MKEKYYDYIINGVSHSRFMPLPTNFGYRDSKAFYCSKGVKPVAVGIPNRKVDISSVRYAAERLNDKSVTFTDGALEKARSIIEDNIDTKNFGNARFVRNLYEKTVVKHATNTKDNKRKDVLITITDKDINIDNVLNS